MEFTPGGVWDPASLPDWTTIVPHSCPICGEVCEGRTMIYHVEKAHGAAKAQQLRRALLGRGMSDGEPVPPAEPNTFRRLVEGKITPDEYVRKLDKRVQETREANRPAAPQTQTEHE